MDFKFSKDSAEPSPEASAGKGRQNFLLVVLLLLVAGFGYLYFFTDLIKPQEAQKPAETPAPQVVKKPLPPREGQTTTTGTGTAPAAKKEGAAPAKTEPQKVAATEAPATKLPPPAKQEPSKPAKPTTPPPVAEKKPATVAVAGQKQPPATPKADQKKPVPAEKQPVAASKKVPSAKEVDKKTADAGKSTGPKGAVPAGIAQKKAVTKPVKHDDTAAGPWTVLVGNYVLEDALAADLGRVRKAGLEATIKQGPRKKSHMNRLLLGDYADRATAQAELDKLKRSTSDAFILKQGERHYVYAGSYLLNERASSEKGRLGAAGFNLTLKRTEVAIPSKSLTAGTFSSRKSAETALKKLKDVGVKATLSHDTK